MMWLRKHKVPDTWKIYGALFASFTDSGLAKEIYNIGAVHLNVRERLLEALGKQSFEEAVSFIKNHPPASQTEDYLSVYLLRDQFLDAFVFVALDPYEPFENPSLIKVQQVSLSKEVQPDFELIYPFDQK